jgi:hypothetical protein
MRTRMRKNRIGSFSFFLFFLSLPPSHQSLSLNARDARLLTPRLAFIFSGMRVWIRRLGSIISTSSSDGSPTSPSGQRCSGSGNKPLLLSRLSTSPPSSRRSLRRSPFRLFPRLLFRAGSLEIAPPTPRLFPTLYFCVVSLNPTSQAPFPFLPQSFILCIFIFQSSLFSFFLLYLTLSSAPQWTCFLSRTCKPTLQYETIRPLTRRYTRCVRCRRNLEIPLRGEFKMWEEQGD